MTPAAVLATALTAVGCATPTPTPWTVEPIYRTQNASLQAAANGAAYAEVARMFEYEARWAQAVQWWQKAANVEKPDPDHVTALGAALLQLGQHDAAVAAFARAAALQPGNARALNNHAYALALNGQPAQAAPLLRQALSIDPTHARAQANLAWVDQQVAAALPPASPAAPTPSSAPREAAPATATAAAATALPVEDLINREPPAAGSPMNTSAAAASVLRGTEPVAPDASRAATVETPAPTTSITSPTGTASPTSAAPPTAAEPPAVARALAPGRLAIANGVGVTGAAAGLDRHLAAQGHVAARLQNIVPYRVAETTIEYRPGFGAAARQVARSMPASTTLVETAALDARFDVRVVLGHDRKEALEACARQATCAAPNTAGIVTPRRS